jgi:chromosomal replication initiation ATPase DnaA
MYELLCKGLGGIMENAHREISEGLSFEVNLSATELIKLRTTLMNSIKKIDGLISSKRIRGKNMEDFIVNGACEYWHIQQADLRKKARNPDIIKRRRIVIHLLKTYTNRNTSDIASTVGLTNHSTVLHHVKEADNFLSEEFYGDIDFQISYKQVLNYLNLNSYDKTTEKSDGH